MRLAVLFGGVVRAHDEESENGERRKNCNEKGLFRASHVILHSTKAT
jgi:hypothetical protein